MEQRTHVVTLDEIRIAFQNAADDFLDYFAAYPLMKNFMDSCSRSVPRSLEHMVLLVQRRG